jgi:hypothetical protein
MQGPYNRSRGSTQVDSSQHMDKNDYYHSFKTRLGSRPKTRFKSWVGRSTCQVGPDFITRIIIILLISALNIN